MANEQKGLGSGEVGDPPRFELVRRVRPTFRVAFEYDGTRTGDESDGFASEPVRRVVKRTFLSRVSAYRWLARRMIFARRDRYATGPVPAGEKYPPCSLCETSPAPDRYASHWESYEPPGCKYHQDTSFRRLEARLSRWLMWRDSRRAGTP